ncbi:MAG: ribulose-phosphate 3-epimerase [Bacillota bacterium]|nr:ribulose-phosphate 3-epimerase [Bacillota bacterium]
MSAKPDPHPVRIAPSLLAADFTHLAQSLAAIESEADLLHLDIMDGRFVPNFSFGYSLLEALRPLTRLHFDVHLMIQEPERYIEDFAAAGAQTITVHVETCPHIARTLDQIRATGARAGVTLNPGTSLAQLDAVFELADQVLIMSVNPGFGGQHYLPAATERIRRLRERIDALGLSLPIEVDGGITTQTAPIAAAAGADILVAGSSVFKAPDPAAAIRALRQSCRSL